ncbi:hypothetical protein BK129_14785 [Paenibacillus amylolyticus]|uniref:hypothetical protein n=1 Tax=Paenibacillus amylolyticus TaxID=1451 RepID=UPI00096DDF2E|nr:hypothetical protein [Paenibacillus amylolyticus]OMF05250.1 hypothetical protein BK129_14785 [Paenibacillus amylolyticus]
MSDLSSVAFSKAKKASRGILPYGFAEQQSRKGYIPQFDKVKGDPIYTAAMAGTNSMYWFRAIKVEGLIANPKGKYYATFSTNHDARGGIGLAYSNDPKGPWIKHGEVYVDTVVGNSTETPFVIYNEKENLFFMYYQQSGAGINQSTLLATSVDMLTWTRVGIVLDKPPGFPGDGHTGYFACFILGDKWIGFSVMGGGDFGRKAIWYSNDGRDWVVDPRTMLGGNDATLTAGENFSRSNAGVFEYRGRLWWAGMMSAYASGGVTTVARPAVALISENMRQLLHRPMDINFPPQAWETTNMQSMMVSVIDGVVYIYYVTDKNVGVAYSVEVDL